MIYFLAAEFFTSQIDIKFAIPIMIFKFEFFFIFIRKLYVYAWNRFNLAVKIDDVVYCSYGKKITF